MSGVADALAAEDQDLAPALAVLDGVRTGGDTFDPGALLRATGLLHGLGEDRAARALAVYGQQADLGPGRPGGQVDGLRPILAARLLYVPRPGTAPLPSPALGKPDIDLGADPTLCPNWPLVVSCDVPFLPIGGWFIGGAPTSAERFVARARELGRLRDRPLLPTCGPAEAADRLLRSDAWRQLVPERQEAYARSLVYGQALIAARSALAIGDDALTELATASGDDLEATWRRLTAAGAARPIRWDPNAGFVPDGVGENPGSGQP